MGWRTGMASGTTPAASQKERQFPCRECGANLQFEPGQTCLKCPYCGVENEIAKSEAVIEELDFRQALAGMKAGENTQETLTIKCDACGAESALPPNVTADRCPFCGSPIVAEARSTRQIKPKSLLPFKIKQNEASDKFRLWIGSLWFAPTGLRRYAEAGSIKGVYIPFWTYDAETFTNYTGERGDDYQETETYTTTENGQTVTRTRTVTKTRWTWVSGRVNNSFDDILVLASESLPRKHTDRLAPFDLEALVPYRDEYLAGFTTESYQLDLEKGFELARQIIDSEVRATINRDIGGDHQRIQSVDTRYTAITYKHILLPIWISAYRYHDTSYRFLVNARTGKVSGERPWSAWKIVLLIAIVLAVIGAIILMAHR